MARTGGSWWVLAVLTLAATVQTWGCDEPERPDATIDVGAVLDATPAGVVVPAIEAFRSRAVTLQATLAAWVDSGADADRDAARAAWFDAMRAWHEVEAMKLGPTASSLTAVGGLDLAAEIYSWPTVNPCRVDQETVEEDWDSASYFDDNLVNAYGMDAIEYLLWAGPENRCPGQIPINRDGTWDALGPDGIAANRAAFARALAQGVVTHTDVLLDAWDGFALDAATYGSEQEALNGIFDALWHLEAGIKDLRLAEPMGLRDCTSNCVELVESRGLSNGSHVWIRHGLIGVRAMFTGGDGPGFDDALRGAGRDDLVADFVTQLDAAIEAFTALERPVDEAITADPDGLQAAFDQTKAAADLLRGEIVTALALQIPAEAAGDND